MMVTDEEYQVMLLRGRLWDQARDERISLFGWQWDKSTVQTARAWEEARYRALVREHGVLK